MKNKHVGDISVVNRFAIRAFNYVDVVRYVVIVR